MKLVILLWLVSLLMACGAGNPVPAEAFTNCYDKGGRITYTSGGMGTKFICRIGD